MADQNDININIGANPAGVEKGAQKAKAALGTLTKESVELGKAFSRIKAAIDPTFKAQEKYNRTLEDAKKLLDAKIIKKREYATAVKAAQAALESEIVALTKNTAAGRQQAEEQKRLKIEQANAARKLAQEEAAAARIIAREKIEAARLARREQEKAEQAEQRAIKLAAQLARQAARETARASATPTARAIGRVEPGSISSSKSIKQLENDIARAMQKLDRLTQEAEAAAVRAATASSAKIAQIAEQTARRRAQSAAETRDRVLQMERELASQVGALHLQEVEKVKAAKAAERDAIRQAAAEAKKAAADKKAADDLRAKSAREAAAAVEEQARAEKRLSQSASELRASISPVFAAQERYNETMRTATQLLMTNRLRQGEWIQIQRQAKAQMDVNIRSMGRFNSVGVQLGYQMQDVAASIASGINPLVILAQQGGQTASALSMLGGRVGAVAAIFGGIWVQAILAAVMIGAQLWGSLDEGKKKTLDLADAESRRTAKVKDLTQALYEYLIQQREANNTNLYNITQENNRNYTDQQRRMRDLTAAQAELNSAKAEFNRLAAMPIPAGKAGEAQAGAVAAAAARLRSAEQGVTTAQENLKVVTQNLTESRVKLGQATAEATDADREHQRNVQKLTDTYRASAQTTRDYTTYTSALRAENNRYTKAKEAETQARRDNTRAAREEARAVFQSREAAIGVAGRELRRTGYSVTENNQFGGVKGNHPGMGNAAHGKYAIDINMPGVGQEAYDPIAKERMDKMVAAYQARGFRVLWNGKVYNPHGQGASYDIPAGQNQHTNHAHMEAPQSIVGKPAGSRLGTQLANEAAQQVNEIAQDTVAAFSEAQAEIEADTSKSLDRQFQEIMDLQERKIQVLKDAYGKDSREASNAEKEKFRIIRQYNERVLKDKERILQKSQEIAGIELRAAQQVEVEGLGIKKDNVDSDASMGILSDQEALAAKARILDEEYNMQVAHEDRMFALQQSYLNKQLLLENQTPEQIANIQTQIERNEAEHLARRGVMYAQYVRGINQANNAMAQTTMAKWDEVTTTLTGSFTSAFQGLWTRSISIQQALINMADQMVYKLVDMGAKAAQQQIRQWIRTHLMKKKLNTQELLEERTLQAAKTASSTAGAAAQLAPQVAAAATEKGIHAATATAKVASEGIKTGAATTGAVAQTGAAAAAGTSEITTHAATAAAGAYKSTVVIPFIGPVAAPAAAALALAAVLGFAALISAKGGMGEVPGDQLAMVHKKEMILPAWIAEPMRRQFLTRGSSDGMIGNASSAGTSARQAFSNRSMGDVNFHYKPNNNNMHTSFDEMLKRDSRAMRRWIKNEIRNGTIGMGIGR